MSMRRLSVLVLVALASTIGLSAFRARGAETRRESRRGGDRRAPLHHIEDGKDVIPAGEALVFRYRVVIHHGDPAQAKVAEAYRQFAAQK